MISRTLCLGLMLVLARANPAEAARVALVGCPSDGQLGPQPAPRKGATPDLAGPAAAKLAYYVAADGLGLLAPRGWHCFGLYGSNGSTIIVAPLPLSWDVVTNHRG